MVEKAIAGIDWAKVDATTDADIERQIEDDPDAAPDVGRERAVRAWAATDQSFAERIRCIRKALDLSRSEFARAYSVPLRTMEEWEQGTRQPDPSAQALLTLIAHMPEGTRQVLERREAAE